MIVLLPFFVQSTISATLIKLFSLIQSSTACSVGVNFTPSFTVPFTVSFTVPFTVPFNEIFVLNTSPSINSGIVPEYTLLYFTIFLTPEPSSSAQPISLKTDAITGFFGYGTKSVKLIVPRPRALLPFSVLTQSFSMISFAGYALEYSR